VVVQILPATQAVYDGRDLSLIEKWSAVVLLHGSQASPRRGYETPSAAPLQVYSLARASLTRMR
jgi:hypothetical protein